MAKASENPMLSKNIPPAPPLLQGSGAEVQGKKVSDNSGVKEKEYQGIQVEEQNGKKASGYEEEKATIELSLYLRPIHDDKLEELRLAYKRRVGKKISANEIIRRIIDRASLEDIL